MYRPKQSPPRPPTGYNARKEEDYTTKQQWERNFWNDILSNNDVSRNQP